jgi:hypothetical protein
VLSVGVELSVSLRSGLRSLAAAQPTYQLLRAPRAMRPLLVVENNPALAFKSNVTSRRRTNISCSLPHR